MAGGLMAEMKKPKRVPIRTCVVCRETDAKMKLVRVVRQKAADGTVTVLVDRTGKANGRGAYVCSRVACVEAALKQRKFERSLKVASLSEEFARDLRSVLEAASVLTE
jgi:hypothetical protein